MKTLITRIDPSARKWWVVDLDGQRPGRVATRVAQLLRGKNKTIFAPQVDNGDNVIAINAARMAVGPKKAVGKKYYHYSGYPGGLKITTLGQMMATRPERVFTMAVRRMLPKNRLARKQFKKLHVYAGPLHPHAAQKPEKFEL